MYRIVKTLLLLLLPLMTVAQEQKSVKPISEAGRVLMRRFPSTRFLDFEYEVLTPADYDSKYRGKDYEEGRIRDINRVKLSMNYPVYKTPRLAITPHLRYKYESMTFSDVKNMSDQQTIYHRKTEEYHYFFTSLNTTYFAKMFGKHVVYTFAVSADASQKEFENVAAYLMAVMVLKREPGKAMTVGLMAFWDERMLLPVVPVFSYETQIGASQWTFDMAIPRYIYFRRPLCADGRLSLGTLYEGSHFYRYPDKERLHHRYDVVKREIRVGALYEHFINDSFILSFRGGYAHNVAWKVTKKNSSSAIIKYSPDASAYFNIGLSYIL